MSAHPGAHQGHDKHAGHDPEAFRRKFWLSLALTIPIVAASHMIMDWFGYAWTSPASPGSARHRRVFLRRLAVPGRRGH